MIMNKRLVVLGILILGIAIIGKLIFVLAKNIKVDEFHKSAVIFVVDSSASNQSKLSEQIKYLKSLCSILDPEDEVKILKVSQKAYLIYEGTPSDSMGITKAVTEFTKYDKNDYGTAYGEGLKKAFSHALTMKKEGYIPAIVTFYLDKTSLAVIWNKITSKVNLIPHLLPLSTLFTREEGEEKK